MSPASRTNFIPGIFAGLLAAIGWGTIGLWIQGITLPAMQIAIWRLLGAGILLLLVHLLLRKIPRVPAGEVWKVLSCGIVLGLQFWGTIVAYASLRLGEATLLTNLHLIFLLIFLPFPEKRRILFFQAVALMILLLLGITFIFPVEFSYSWHGIGFGVLASFFFALYTKLTAVFFPGNPERFLVWYLLGGGLFCLFFSFGAAWDFENLMADSWKNLSILILFSTLSAHFFYLKSVKYIGVFPSGILAYFSIFIAVLLDAVMGVHFSLLQLSGVGIAVLSLGLLLNISQQSKK